MNINDFAQIWKDEDSLFNMEFWVSRADEFTQRICGASPEVGDRIC